jgi:hypothetical protein
MGFRYLSLVAALSALATRATAGDEGGHEVTKWMTTTCWETAWQEKSVETHWSTSYYTKWVPTTITETYYPEPTTKTTTIYDTETVTETSIQISGVTNTATAISIATETAAITDVSVVLTTVFETITPEIAPPVTVTSCPTTTLEGLVLCPSRTSKAVQPTFPADYLWGCPPGTICKPKQVDCNFEQNVPEDGYYCDPADGDMCIPTPPLPPYEDTETNYTCGNLLDPAPGYFDFDPHLFGTDFSIYNFGGQIAKPCEVPRPPPSSPPPSSTKAWQSWSPPPSSSYVSPVWESWSAAPPSSPASPVWQSWSPPAVTPSPPEPDKTWQQWDSTEVVPASKTWGGWSEPNITPRSILALRQLDSIVPIICMDKCQQCIRKGEQAGKRYELLCPAEVEFQRAYRACNQCVMDNKPGTPNEIPPLLSSIIQILAYCRTAAPSTSTTQIVPPQLPQEVTTSTTVVTSITTTEIAPASPPPISPPTTSAAAPASPPPISSPTTSAAAPASPPPTDLPESVTLITSCNCVTITSTLSAGSPAVSQISDGQVSLSSFAMSWQSSG